MVALHSDENEWVQNVYEYRYSYGTRYRYKIAYNREITDQKTSLFFYFFHFF